MDVPYIGEALSLAAAVAWAMAIVLFRKSGEHVHPVALNAFKDVAAALLYVPTIYFAGGTLFEPFALGDYGLAAASGAVGIALGDTLLFQCLNMVGASATALVSTLYSPFTIALGFLWLGETMSPLQLVGVALILGAVLETTRGARERKTVGRGRLLLGIGVGVVAVLSMAVGIVMVKPLLDRAPLLWTVEIRLLGGVAALLVYLAFNPNRRRILSTLWVRESRAVTVTSSVLGGYVAMVIWLGGMKFTQVSIASALNQTNTVFVLIFAAWILRERISPARVVAIVVAFVGATLVTIG
jgi:drug/metabolite transporter (DMT)-like permease